MDDPAVVGVAESSRDFETDGKSCVNRKALGLRQRSARLTPSTYSSTSHIADSVRTKS